MVRATVIAALAISRSSAGYRRHRERERQWQIVVVNDDRCAAGRTRGVAWARRRREHNSFISFDLIVVNRRHGDRRRTRARRDPYRTRQCLIVHTVLRCAGERDRKSTRLNSSHGYISHAVFCLETDDGPAINFSARALVDNET